jgi:integrase
MELNIRPVYLNGKRRYRWKYIGDDTKPKSITKNTYKECKEKAEEKIQEVGFTKFDSQEVTLNEAYESFYKRLKYKIREGVIEVGHAKDYGSFYTNHILPYFSNVDIRKIGEQEINGFVKYLTDKLFSNDLKAKTIRKIFNTLSAILQNQVDPPNRKIKRNICKDANWMTMVVTSRTKPERIDFDYWNMDLMKKIIHNIPRYKVQLICKILLECALRPSEARCLTLDDLLNFDPSSNLPPIIDINKSVKSGTKKIGDPKTDNGFRQLVISNDLRDEINKYVKTLPKDQNYLFLDKTNSPIRLEAIIRGIDKSLNKLDLTLPIKRKGYFFRHYTASFWAYTSKYKNAIDLAKALGDKSIDFVQDNYIALYLKSEKEVENVDYQNKHFNWK